MGAVGLAPCAVALLVVGQVPMTTNGMLTYAKKSLGSKLSFFYLYNMFCKSAYFCAQIHFKNTNTRHVCSQNKSSNRGRNDPLVTATHFLLDGRWQSSQKLRADFCNSWSSQYWCSGGGQTGADRRTGGWSDAKLILEHFSANIFRKCCKERGIHTLWQANA